MYIAPHQHECPQCKHKVDYSPRDGWEYPQFGEEFERKMVCPKCFEKFIRANVPMLKPVLKK